MTAAVQGPQTVTVTPLTMTTLLETIRRVEAARMERETGRRYTVTVTVTAAK